MTIKQQGGVFGRNPSFNDVEANDLTVTGPTSLDGAVVINESGADVDFRVESDGNTHALFVNAGNNRIGINNPNPLDTLDVVGTIRADQLQMDDNQSIYLGNGGIFRVFNDGATSIIRSQGEPLYFDANGITFRGFSPYTTLMSIAQDGNVSIPVGNLSFANGKGVDFSATSGTGTSELFDDYEEGTWTPTFTVEWATPPAVTSAQYTKIGRQVTVTLLATGGVVTAGGGIGGLPFASNATQGAGAYGGNSDTTESLQGTVGQTASSITNIPARTLIGDTWQITATYFAN